MTTSVAVGFGYVISPGTGELSANLAQFVPDEVADVGDWAKKTLEREGLDASVQVDYFAYALDGLVLVAKDSVTEADGWSIPLDGTLPPPGPDPEGQWARELAQALDVLGWEEAGLGQPTWFAYACYG
jgi:hypothetical protein